MAEWYDMQGLVLSAYPHLDAAEYVPLRIENPAQTREWLKWIAGYVTTASDRRAINADANSYIRRLDLDIELNVNIAVTYTGLSTLCALDDHDRDTFLYAFTEGIAGNIDNPGGNMHRSRILGDTGENAPEKWKWGGKHVPVDVLLMVFAKNEEARRQAVDKALTSSGMVRILKEEALAALSLKEADGKEHFGFVDGKSQPILKGTADAERFPDSIHLTDVGEFVFGYPDGEKPIVEGPTLRDWKEFGKNGTYLVFRQLEQDVCKFWDFAYEQTRPRHGIDDPFAATQLASKIIGRRPDGTPLIPYGQADDNEFDFSDDPHGYGCPVGAHIRRAHPRGSLSADTLPRERLNRHRVLRRGRLYGSRLEYPNRDDERRGLLFLVLNSDFERQFEFVSQNWVNNPGFCGLEHEVDPLVGLRDPASRSRFTLPGLPARTRIESLPDFVTVRGGEYFFLPGITALKYLGGAA
jgi:Dyp-type peroxidase family